MRRLIDELRRRGLSDPEEALEQSRISVNGVIVKNPNSQVSTGASIRVAPPTELRGATKLRNALDHFGIDVADKTALDCGAAAGGFTKESSRRRAGTSSDGGRPPVRRSAYGVDG